MASKFRYEVIVTGGSNPINLPINIFDVTFNDDPLFQVSVQREKGTMYFIRKIKNKLTVMGSDFDIFRGYIGSCYKFWLNIYKDCLEGEVLLARGFFNEKNMEFDFDKCSVEIEIQDKSPYQCFKDKKNEQFDVYGVAQTANVFLYVGPTKFRTKYWGDIVLLVAANLGCCDEYGCYYNLISDFFDWQDDGFGGTLFPDDQTWTNYVNVLQPNYYLRLAAKSDVKNPTATNPATKLMLSFDDIERVHKEVFNVYWVLEGTRLRWEHYSWFSQSVNYDAISATNLPLNLLKNKISFATDDLPEREEFLMMEANGVDFIGAPIIYDENCANGKTVNRGFGRLTTDTDYIINNSSSIENDGFVLIDAYKVNATPEWYVQSAVGAISVSSKRNGRLSWANLHYDLHRHGRPFITGTMNNTLQTFLSKEPDIVQENIVTELCCEDEFEKHESTVRTYIGDGIIDEAEIDYTNELIKFKLRHQAIPTNI